MKAIDTKKELDLAISRQLSEKNKQYIAGFTQSMMKKPEQFAPGHFPILLESGDGAVVKDVDGNEYIDFISGLAANTLGHNHPVVNNAILKNLKNGIIHSLPTPIEATAAKALVDIVPGAEMARFFKTGADANSAAIRLARFITKKEKIITVGYNGWHDQFMFDTPGVPETLANLTFKIPLFIARDEAPLFELINSKGDQLAAVLISVPYNRILSQSFFSKLREVCTNQNVILIMDEVVTGFRLALGGAQEFYDVSADLVTLSKGIAAGMPLSAVTGSKKLMEKMEQLQVSTTFGGETLSLEVCHAVLKEYSKGEFIKHIYYLGAKLKKGVNEVSKRLGTSLVVVGYDPIPMFLFDKNPMEHVKIAEPFLAEMAKRGVLLRREVNFISGVHTEEQIIHTIKAVEKSLIKMLELGLFNTQLK